MPNAAPIAARPEGRAEKIPPSTRRAARILACMFIRAKHQATAGNHHLTVDDRGSRSQEPMFTLALIDTPLAEVIR